MTDSFFKGFGLMSANTWLQKECNETQIQNIHKSLPDEYVTQIESLKPEQWYPSEWFGYLILAILSEKNGNAIESYQLIEKLTAHIATENLSTVMNLLIKFLTPPLLMKTLPKFWKKYFKGAETVGVDIGHSGENKGAMFLNNFSTIRYTGPIVSGWIIEAFHLIGTETVEIQEVINNPEDVHNLSKPAPTHFRWEIQW